MTNSMMSTVEFLGVHPIEMSHALRKITFDRLHHKMIMIGQLTPGMTSPIKPFTHLTQDFQPNIPIRLAEKNILAPITARGHMVEATRQFYS
jgi:hypothetical protein